MPYFHKSGGVPVLREIGFGRPKTRVRINHAAGQAAESATRLRG